MLRQLNLNFSAFNFRQSHTLSASWEDLEDQSSYERLLDAVNKMGSLIDDRCPTVWQFPLGGKAEAAYERRISSGAHANQPSPLPAAIVRNAAESRRRDGIPRSEARKEPLDGNLLMKLYRATVDDRRRSAEAIGKQNDSRGTDANDALRETPALEPRAPRGFYLPKGISRELQDEARVTHDERPVIHTAKPAKKKKATKESPARLETPQKPTDPAPDAAPSAVSIHSNKSVRVVGKNGEEVFVEMPNLPLVMEESLPGSRAQGFEPTEEMAKEAEPKLSKKQQKKMEKSKEQQNENGDGEPEALADPELPEEDFVEKPVPDLCKKQRQKKKSKQQTDREEDAAVAAEALMSGALPEETTGKHSRPASKHSDEASNIGWEGIFDAPVSSHSKTKESHRSFEPTVESARSSRASRKGGRVSKLPSQKAPSFVGFEEIGGGIYEASTYSSKKGKSRAKSKSPSIQGFEEVRAPTPPSRIPSPKVGSRVTSDGSRRSVNRFESVSVRESQDGWIQMPAIIKSISVQSRSKSQSRPASITNEQLAERLWQETGSVDGKPKASLASGNGSPVAEVNEWASNGPGKYLSHASPAISRHSTLAREGEWVELEPQEEEPAHSSATPRSKNRSSKDLHLPFDNRRHSPSQSEHFVEQPCAAFSAQGQSHHSRRSRVAEDVAFQELQDANTTKTTSPSMFEEIAQVAPKEHGGGDSSRVPSTHDWATWNTFDAQSQRLSDVGSKTSSRSCKQRGHLTARKTHSELRSRHSRQTSCASPARPVSAQGPWKRNSDSHASSSRESLPAFNAVEVGSTSDGRAEKPYERPPTVFAGKGWISPHPLSRSPTELASPPQSKIVLPSEAFPQGATMTYEEWKDMQDRGMRMHRNFSHTESSHGRTAKLADRRYTFTGWRGEQTQRSELEPDGPGAEGSAVGTASYHAPTVESEHSSQRTAPRHSRHSFRHQQQNDWSENRWPPHSEHGSGRLSHVHAFSQTSRHSSGRHERSRSASQSATARSERSSQHGGRPEHASRASSSRHSRHTDSKSFLQGSHGSSSFRNHSHLASNIATLRSDRWNEQDEHSARESERSSHQSSHRSSRHRRVKTISEASHHSSRHRQSYHSSRHASSRRSNPHSVHSHIRSASDWNQRYSHLDHSEHGSAASRSSSEKITAAMEEGRNVWSNVPQYDGTASDEERSQGHGARSETATSQLYLERYRESGDSSEEDW